MKLFSDQLNNIIEDISGYKKHVKKSYICECGKVYAHYTSLWNHRRYNCGKPPQFPCPYCIHQSFRKNDLKCHIILKHPGQPSVF